MAAKKEKTGQWVKALKPGWLGNARLVKAGEKFQLDENTPFSDNWMEKTDAPEAAKPSKERQLAEQIAQEQSVMQHEKDDDVRRGKFTIRSVPRSEEGEKAHKAAVKEKAKGATPGVDASKAQPVVVVDPAQVAAAKQK